MTALPEGAPIAVVVVRDGVLPLGADETVAEAGGTALLVGTDPGTAVAELTGARTVWCAENGAFTPARWASQLAPVLAASGPILLPASPDGRDLAPRLAAAMDRPLLAGAVRVMESGAEVVRWGGRVAVELTCEGPFVATFQPGVRGVESSSRTPRIVELFLPDAGPALDATTIAITGPDPATADLAEAPRILAAGAGLGRGELPGPDAVALLRAVAGHLGASLGATRVVTDAGWASYERQIGTTGVVVTAELYVAFGISGAAQHLGGLGDPRHVVSVNLDPSCPMTMMADLGIVADAPAMLEELAKRLGVSAGEEQVLHG
ncbi:MAG: Electron transfer flavoprotein alpha subunit [Actinomycetia bacterium]|nr:Electron transfer flavoprotein alpha subunit [Actinomycetes bacterium]